MTTVHGAAVSTISSDISLKVDDLEAGTLVGSGSLGGPCRTNVAQFTKPLDPHAPARRAT
jgi:hypothetical protein